MRGVQLQQVRHGRDLPGPDPLLDEKKPLAAIPADVAVADAVDVLKMVTLGVPATIVSRAVGETAGQGSALGSASWLKYM